MPSSPSSFGRLLFHAALCDLHRVQLQLGKGFTTPISSHEGWQTPNDVLLSADSVISHSLLFPGQKPPRGQITKFPVHIHTHSGYGATCGEETVKRSVRAYEIRDDDDDDDDEAAVF